MKAMVIYESMFGNTHLVAERIAAGLRSADVEADVVPAHDAATAPWPQADLVVVGGPTHVHGLPSARTRDGAGATAAKPDSGLTLEPDADRTGVREWLEAVGAVNGAEAAAFDTRIDAHPTLTGRASKGIAKRLRHHGFRVVTEPESFLVDKHSHLLPGEAERAEAWGAALATAMASATAP